MSQKITTGLRSSLLGVGLVVLAVILAVVLGTVPAQAVSTSKATSGPVPLTASIDQKVTANCPYPTTPNTYRCLSRRLPGSSVQPGFHATATKILGLKPQDVRVAYQLPSVTSKRGAGQTVAIVDAFDNPTVEADLQVYRKTFGLGPCTSAGGCFRKVDQRGGTHYPKPDAGWAGEIALDVQAVSAVCPRCKILLVEGDAPSVEGLGESVNTAVRLGADVVSNSYGSKEVNGLDEVVKRYYTHPGVPLVVSSGDDGFQDPEFPASVPTNWAIGGTSLTPAKNGQYREVAADFAGSSCSPWFAKPAYQKDKHCPTRTVADISAAATGPYGFAVYQGSGSGKGWAGFEGTSLSAPLVAAMIALAGNAKQASTPAYAYRHRSGLKDVVGGSNPKTEECGGDYLCTAVKGYDGPTGLGTPRGLKAL